MIAEIKTEQFTDWVQCEIECWSVKKLSDPHVLYEHLKRQAPNFGIDPETAAKLVKKELSV